MRASLLFQFIWLFLIISIPVEQLYSNRNLGTPFVKNYQKEVYKAGTQTWDIKQHKSGLLYFANNSGLLEFDGTNWNTYPVNNKTNVRSLDIDDSGRIYVGAQGEIGYFFPNKIGKLDYHSLMKDFPPHLKEFDDVWDLKITGNAVYFRIGTVILLYKNDTFQEIKSDSDIVFLGGASDALYAVTANQQLFLLDGSDLRPLELTTGRLPKEVTSIIPLNNNDLLITSLKNGAFLYSNGALKVWNDNLQDFLKTNRIYSASSLPNGQIALGTSFNGLLVTDSEGKPYYHLTKNNGLQNNNILSVESDDKGDIWIGLNNGIDLIELSSSYFLIYPDSDLEGTSYTSIIHKNKIYLGTSSGLYVADWKSYYDPFSKDRFRLVRGTEGQIWNISKVDDLLIAGHHEGTFLIENDQARQISTINGAWNFQTLASNPDYFICGTYTGIILFKKANGTLQFVRSIAGFEESSRFLEQSSEDHLIWVTHPYRGAFKLTLNEDLTAFKAVKRYSSEEGLSSDLGIHVFKINKQLVFAVNQYVYGYKAASDQFEVLETYNEYLGNTFTITRLKSDKEGNIWYVLDGNVGKIKNERYGLESKVQHYSFSKVYNKLVAGFEYLYPYQEEVFFGTDKGFIYKNNALSTSNSLPKALIRSIRMTTPKDSLLYGGHANEQTQASPVKLHSSYQDLLFTYSSPEFINQVEYSYKLEGLEDNWHSWTTKVEKEYTNLAPGNYTFLVRARLPNQEAGMPDAYSFTIKTPLYRNKLAYLFYVLLALVLLHLWMRNSKNQLEQEKEAIKVKQQEILQQKEEEHRIAVEQSEREIIALKNERLEIEIDHQNQELASLTMHFVQKNELLQNLKDKLKEVISNTKEPITQKNIKRVVRMLDNDAQMSEDWPRFAYYFDRVNQDYTKKLLEKHPTLTQKDVKLCVFLKMNLSTKEIAPLLNISIRGVEISRYRLRKKLELKQKERLSEYLQGV